MTTNISQAGLPNQLLLVKTLNFPKKKKKKKEKKETYICLEKMIMRIEPTFVMMSYFKWYFRRWLIRRDQGVDGRHTPEQRSSKNSRMQTSTRVSTAYWIRQGRQEVRKKKRNTLKKDINGMRQLCAQILNSHHSINESGESSWTQQTESLHGKKPVLEKFGHYTGIMLWVQVVQPAIFLSH